MENYQPPMAPMCSPQPIDCSSDALDLCVRKRCRSTTPEMTYNVLSEKPLYGDPPTSMCFSSPGSQGSDTSETSGCSEPFCAYPMAQDSPVIQKAKIPRPFKAYPKDPLHLAVGVATAEAILGKDAADGYVEFRHRMLSQVQNQAPGTNIKMRRTTLPASNALSSDPTYWEKRRKNNEAAKRSRDARRAKEDEIAIRCAYLEQENLKLRYEVSALRNESERLRTLVYN